MDEQPAVAKIEQRTFIERLINLNGFNTGNRAYLAYITCVDYHNLLVEEGIASNRDIYFEQMNSFLAPSVCCSFFNSFVDRSYSREIFSADEFDTIFSEITSHKPRYAYRGPWTLKAFVRIHMERLEELPNKKDSKGSKRKGQKPSPPQSNSQDNSMTSAWDKAKKKSSSKSAQMA